jgi:hypothetical protein
LLQKKTISIFQTEDAAFLEILKHQHDNHHQNLQIYSVSTSASILAERKRFFQEIIHKKIKNLVNAARFAHQCA